jgi:hypothetical protein
MDSKGISLNLRLRKRVRPDAFSGIAHPPDTSETVSWLCEHCGNPAEIEAVELSLDGTRMLTLWHCSPCQTWGVTPDTIRQPPVWVSEREQ